MTFCYNGNASRRFSEAHAVDRYSESIVNNCALSLGILQEN